jgi:predicted MFS family arabinose efflux permease
MVGPARFAVRVGRNEAFNHAGNVGAAILAGSLGYFMGREWIFYLVAAMAAASMVSVLFIEAEDIDYRLARAAASDRSETQPAAAPIGALLRRQPIVMFAASVTLFHFANAAMLPLAGQMLSQGNAANASLYMSACVIAAQLVMIPVSAVAGTLAEKWGRKPIFLVGFAVLPVRGWLYTMSDDPLFIVAVQLLDGIGAGIFGVLWVTVVADLTKGTGRYNFALGAIAAAQGVGASLSNVTAGYVVGTWGYDAAFLMLSAVALAALTVYYLAMTEPHLPISVETIKVHVPVRCPANES